MDVMIWILLPHSSDFKDFTPSLQWYFWFQHVLLDTLLLDAAVQLIRGDINHMKLIKDTFTCQVYAMSFNQYKVC